LSYRLLIEDNTKHKAKLRLFSYFAVQYALAVQTFQTQIIKIFLRNACFFVGETNNYDGSEIGFLFLTSCNKQIVNLDENARFQMVFLIDGSILWNYFKNYARL
jgi:hypothetical protein